MVTSHTQSRLNVFFLVVNIIDAVASFQISNRIRQIRPNFVKYFCQNSKYITQNSIYLRKILTLSVFERCVSKFSFKIHTAKHFINNTHLWETHLILTQNLKMICLWILQLIITQISTFLTNVGLPLTTHTCYYQHSPLSVSLSIILHLKHKLFFPSHTLVPPLTLYPRPCENTFDISESVSTV